MDDLQFWRNQYADHGSGARHLIDALEAEVVRLQARERELEAARDSAWSDGYSAGARAAHRAARASVSAETEDDT